MTGKVTVENPELASRFSYEPPLGRMGETRDLTGAVNFLLSESSAYISGSDILITGGLHAGRYAKDREPPVSQ
jgi:sorbose reductase